MKQVDTGFIPVQQDDKLVGTLTDRDIVIRSISQGKDPKTTKVSEAMNNEVVYCFDDQDVEQVTRTLGDKQIRRLPVLNRDKRLVGVLSLGDIAGNANVNNTVDKISEPSSSASKTSGAKHP